MVHNNIHSHRRSPDLIGVNQQRPLITASPYPRVPLHTMGTTTARMDCNPFLHSYSPVQYLIIFINNVFLFPYPRFYTCLQKGAARWARLNFCAQPHITSCVVDSDVGYSDYIGMTPLLDDQICKYVHKNNDQSLKNTCTRHFPAFLATQTC